MDPGSHEVSDVFDLAAAERHGGDAGAELSMAEGLRMPCSWAEPPGTGTVCMAEQAPCGGFSLATFILLDFLGPAERGVCPCPLLAPTVLRVPSHRDGFTAPLLIVLGTHGKCFGF